MIWKYLCTPKKSMELDIEKLRLSSCDICQRCLQLVRNTSTITEQEASHLIHRCQTSETRLMEMDDLTYSFLEVRVTSTPVRVGKDMLGNDMFYTTINGYEIRIEN